jgi:uncharacterized protein YhaN
VSDILDVHVAYIRTISDLNQDKAELLKRIKRLEDAYAAKDKQLSNLLHICRDNDIEVSSYDLIHGRTKP